MTTARKTTAAKKTPTKRVPAKRAPVKSADAAAPDRVSDDRAKQISAFEALRDRAAKIEDGILTPPTRRPVVVLGPEEGFDPPIIATPPTSLTQRTVLDMVSRNFDVLGILNVLIGPQELLRVAGMFEQQGDGNKLMAGLALMVLDKVYGRGAGDVAGGTPASSTT
ncbi:hypothetical protein [Nocardia cyriacigeorgica]|uniref:hypothetical protein n=1 Tax=Nocardia cyriacigeorgica TaxID=135487 RepID=UPI002456A863|nr:hypothetical protein [Nocardia cyriacigeorgica]